MGKVHNKLLKLNRGKVNSFFKEAKFRQTNRRWLQYSSKIASRISAAMEDIKGMNKTILAERAGISNKCMRNILKGQENLTLKTISKISKVLGVDLITFPDYEYSKPLL